MEIQRKGCDTCMVNIRKISIYVLVVCCMLLFSGCSLLHSKGLYKIKDEDELLRYTADIIIDAFTSKSKEKLINIMSTEALNTSDFDDGFNYCCDLLADGITNVEQKGCPISGHIEKDKSWRKSHAVFYITTSSGTVYSLYFEYWFENEAGDEKLGVNRIQIADLVEQEEDPNFKPGRLYERSGIYTPEWDAENQEQAYSD